MFYSGFYNNLIFFNGIICTSSFCTRDQGSSFFQTVSKLYKLNTLLV